MKTLVLKNKKVFFISPTSPFHFDGTFHKPSHYPDKLDDWESGKYWQAKVLAGHQNRQATFWLEN
mgnify:FL=1